jgi:uncharacterized membrane protein YkoI|tara:strand:- start:2261 stop:2578 length:318 start_codon:yes stop_codon:yes gene_type:complete
MRFIVFSLVLFLYPAIALTEPIGVDQEDARSAVESGQIMPLEDILRKIRSSFGGKILEVILKDHEEGLHGWVYNIKIFTEKNDVILLSVDAGTATVLKVEGKVEP